MQPRDSREYYKTPNLRDDGEITPGFLPNFRPETPGFLVPVGICTKIISPS